MASRTMTVILAGDTKRLDATLSRSEKRLKKFGKVAGVAGVAVAGALTAIAVKTLRTGDELHKMSLRTGLAVEELSALDFVMQQNGGSIDDLERGLQALSRGMGNAALTGTGPFIDGLKLLGLTMDDLEGLDQIQSFEYLADAIAGPKIP